MGINTESNVEASLQIGPTEKGMVRLYVSNNSIEIPMDFEPDEARDCLLYTSPSPRDISGSRMPSSA